MPYRVEKQGCRRCQRVKRRWLPAELSRVAAREKQRANNAEARPTRRPCSTDEETHRDPGCIVGARIVVTIDEERGSSVVLLQEVLETKE